MLGHVFRRSQLSDLLDEVFIATPDDEIVKYIENIDGKAILTSPTHTRASDRVAEAVRIIETDLATKLEIVVMIQGDEPLIHPAMISEVTEPLLEDPSIQVANLMGLIMTDEELRDPNEIKVVTDLENNALYFSRQPIPTRWGQAEAQGRYKQICVIPFQRDFLLEYANLTPTPLEILESIDMLRVLEHGYKVKMIPTDYQVYSVDTPEDLKKVDVIMARDKLFQTYSKSLLLSD